jgi:hypothetical protein
MRLLLVVVAVTLLAGAVPGARASAVRPCQARIDRGVLPVWARTGFSEKAPRAPHVLGRAGRIAAILFGDPLHVPGNTSPNNKILWVARVTPRGPSDLRISAQRMLGTQRFGKPVARVVPGGPGPSIVDLPTAGCWRFTLRWAGRTDELDLQYHRVLK